MTPSSQSSQTTHVAIKKLHLKTYSSMNQNKDSSVRDSSRLLVVCRTGVKQEHARVAAARDTWVADFLARDVEVIFKTGQQGHRREDLPYLDDDLLRCPGADRHSDVANKTFLTLEWVLKNRPDWTHVFIVDDDCIVDVERFMNLDWSNHKVWGCTNTRSFISGSAYVLRRDVVQMLVPKLAVDDTLIAALCAMHGVPMTNTPTISPWLPRDQETNKEHTRLLDHVVVQHYIRTPELIRERHGDIRRRNCG